MIRIFKVKVLLALEDCFSFVHAVCEKAALHLLFKDLVAAGMRRQEAATTWLASRAAGAASRTSHNRGSSECCTTAANVPGVAFYNIAPCGADIDGIITHTVTDTCPNPVSRNRFITLPGRELQLAPVLEKAAAQLRQVIRSCATSTFDVPLRLFRSPIPKCWLPFAFS